MSLPPRALTTSDRSTVIPALPQETAISVKPGSNRSGTCLAAFAASSFSLIALRSVISVIAIFALFCCSNGAKSCGRPGKRDAVGMKVQYSMVVVPVAWGAALVAGAEEEPADVDAFVDGVVGWLDAPPLHAPASAVKAPAPPRARIRRRFALDRRMSCAMVSPPVSFIS